MYNFILILLLFFQAQVILANESVLMSFCHTKKDQLSLMKRQLSFIKNPKDKLLEQSHCLDVKTIRSREDLYFKYIKNKFPQAKITSSNDLDNKNQCHIQLKKINSNNIKSIKIGNDLNKIIVNDKERLGLKSELLDIKIQQNTKAKITIERSSFDLICVKKKNSFGVSTFTTSNELSLQSQLSIRPNVWTEIGKLTKSQKEENKSIAIKANRYNIINNKYTIILLLKIR